MDYQKIKYFLKAAETLNFSEASRQMFITPQAFGRQIAKLEQEMGFALFERSTRHIRLTPSGQICYHNFSERVNDLEKEYQKMCEMGSKRRNQISVGVFRALSLKKVISPIVTGVLANFSDRDVNISMCDIKELREQIQSGRLDLCITITHATESGWTNCKFIPLAYSPARIVVSKYHPWVIQDTVSMEDMKESIFVKMGLPDSAENDYFMRMLCKDIQTVENYESICLRLEQGDCFSVMSEELDSYCEKNGKSFALPWSPFEFELALIYKESNPHSFLPELCRFIKDEFEL